jgi:hypothetical protein
MSIFQTDISPIDYSVLEQCVAVMMMSLQPGPKLAVVDHSQAKEFDEQGFAERKVCTSK